MEIVGRDRELSAAYDFIEQGPSAPNVLVLSGEAGIGKTTVWQACLAHARARGHRVLACAASGAETQLAFTVLRDLVGDIFDEVSPELEAPQRRALGAALLREEARPPPDPAAVSVGVLNALLLLARTQPVTVAVDDVQWADPASALALGYITRRIHDTSIRVLVALRTDPGRALDAIGLDRLGEDKLEIVQLHDLTIGALGALLHQRLGTAYPRPTLHLIRETSAGNPLFALEIARALEEQPARSRPGEPLPVPTSLRALVEERLSALPQETLDALAVAAALSRPTLASVGAVLSGDVRTSLAAAIKADVVKIHGERILFSHPLFASGAYDLSRHRSHDLHGRLAETASDLEERARHLALATDTPSSDVAASLERGAGAAFARGSPSTASELMARARALTPQGDPEALRRGAEEVELLFLAGDTGGASRLLDELLTDTPDGVLRARLLARKARVQHFESDIESSVALLREALGSAQGDLELRGQIEEGLAWGLLLVRQDLATAAIHARSAAELAERHDDTVALAEALAAEALIELVLGNEAWQPAMDRALALEDAMLETRILRHPSFARGYCLSCEDDLDRARDVFAELRRRAESSGDESSMPSLLNHLTLIECLSGRWGEAERHAVDGFERALESGQRPTQVSVLAKRALLAARRGNVDEARALAHDSLSIAGLEEHDPTHPEAAMARGGETAIWALASVELSVGRPDEAVHLLGPMVEALLAAGVREPGELRGLPDLVEGLVVLGHVERAEEVLAPYVASAERLRRASALAEGHRCRALLLSAAGDDDAALAALESAVAARRDVPMPFELGRCLLALGSSQRRLRRRRDSRATLEEALGMFEALGAGQQAATTRTELARIGGRARASGDLTPTEARVAELVASGLTNKEAAAKLVLTVHTVEAALTSIYRKLRVHSRTEMAHKLAEGIPSKD